MKTLRKIDINNRPHYFVNSIANINNFDPSLLRIIKYHLKVLITFFMTLNRLQ